MKANITIIHGSVEDALNSSLIKDNSIEAILSDPPYGISFMNKHWDYDVPTVDVMSQLLKKAKPGAYFFAFGGLRTHHRIMCSIEDAGFELRDCIFWLHSNGFPKSYNISKGLDKYLKADRRVVGKREHPTLKDKSKVLREGGGAPHHGSNSVSDEWDITEDTSDEVKLWSGYGTALKPAYEPVIVSMKPIVTNYAKNAIEHGTGGLNIEASRIPIDMEHDASQLREMNRSAKDNNGWGMNNNSSDVATVVHKKGRFPSNIILDEAIGDGLNEDNDRNVSRFFYCPKPSKKEKMDFNSHPTVKPITLTEYLSKLMLPPENGTILIPFSGSGSEIIGAINAGWKNIIAIEREFEYIDISLKRFKSLGLLANILVKEVKGDT